MVRFKCFIRSSFGTRPVKIRAGRSIKRGRERRLRFSFFKNEFKWLEHFVLYRLSACIFGALPAIACLSAGFVRRAASSVFVWNKGSEAKLRQGRPAATAARAISEEWRCCVPKENGPVAQVVRAHA